MTAYTYLFTDINDHIAAPFMTLKTRVNYDFPNVLVTETTYHAGNRIEQSIEITKNNRMHCLNGPSAIYKVNGVTVQETYYINGVAYDEDVYDAIVADLNSDYNAVLCILPQPIYEEVSDYLLLN